jgi:hypothetical protein
MGKKTLLWVHSAASEPGLLYGSGRYAFEEAVWEANWGNANETFASIFFIGSTALVGLVRFLVSWSIHNW